MTTWYNYIHSFFYENTDVSKLIIERERIEHQKHLLNKQIINSNIKLKSIKSIKPLIRTNSITNLNYRIKSKPINIPKFKPKQPLKPSLSKLIEEEF